MEYEKIRFKCGLEIHQQLDTNKLFCSCPSLNSSAPADIHFERRLRAVVGETGEIDAAAAHEMAKGKKFIYEADSRDCCLVEMDEEPPHQINPEAVNVALEIALLMKAKIVDEIQVMRKTVVDGSNVSGFQRTALIAYDGELETSKGKVRLITICLEEEACQKTEETDRYVKYRLDRLGIPLVEIATDASIKDPEHAKEAAEKIGMILRSTGKVKRGIGTIRQDMNVSISGRARVELKGFQELKMIPAVLQREVERQTNTEKFEPHVRKVEADGSTSFLRPMPGAARMYPETDVVPLRVDVSGIKLPELISDKTERLESLGINKDVAKSIAKEGKTEYFENLFSRFKELKPSFVVEVFMSVRGNLKKDFGIEEEKVKNKDIEKALEIADKNSIPKNLIVNILADIVKGAFDLSRYKGISDDEILEEIEKIVKEKPGLNQGAYMGLIMARFKGKVDGKKAMEILKRVIS